MKFSDLFYINDMELHTLKLLIDITKITCEYQIVDHICNLFSLA